MADFLNELRELQAIAGQPTPEEEDPSLMAEWISGPYIDNGNGTFDCMFHHPAFGDIPFTASPLDVEAHGRAAYAYILTQVPSGGE